MPQVEADWAPRRPDPAMGQNAFHLNDCLLYESLDACVIDQQAKGLGDVRAKQVCQSLWRAMGNNREQALQGFSVNGQWWEDDEYLYVPVTMTSEGVHNGAYKSYAELVKAFPHAENLPITILHPPGRGVNNTDEVHGWVRQTKLDPETAAWKGVAQFIKSERRLKEMGHDESRIKAHLAMLQAIRMGAKFDGSIGYWHGTIFEGGVFKGQRYDRREVNLLPDHLAVVDRGASPWEMGTGFGQSRAEGTREYVEPHEDKPREKKPEDPDGARPVVVNGETGSYDSAYEGRGEPVFSNIFHFTTGEAKGHQHDAWATFILNPDGTSEVALAVDPRWDEPFGHEHHWSNEERTSEDDGHSHALPQDFRDWLAAMRKQAEQRKSLVEGKGDKRVAETFTEGLRRLLNRNSPRVELANPLKPNPGLEHKGSLRMAGNGSDGRDDALVLRSLSVNALAEANPDVKRLVEEHRTLGQNNKTLVEERDRALTENKALKERAETAETKVRTLEENAVKAKEAGEREALVEELTALTGNAAEAYKDTSIGDLRFAVNQFKAFAERHEREMAENKRKAAKNQPPPDEEAMEHAPEDCPDPQACPMHGDMAYGKDAGEEASAGSPELLHASKKGSYEDYGVDPKTGPKPNRAAPRSDRTLLANRIRQGLGAERKSGQGKSPTGNSGEPLYARIFNQNAQAQGARPGRRTVVPAPNGGEA